MQPEKTTNFEAVCARVKALASEKEMTQMDLARIGDVAYRTLHEIWAGTARLRTKSIGRIARALDTTPTYLMTGKGQKDAPLENIVDKLRKEGQAPDGTLSHMAPKREMIAREQDAAYAAQAGKITIDIAVRHIADQLDIPLDQVWHCLNEAIDKKRQDGVNKSA